MEKKDKKEYLVDDNVVIRDEILNMTHEEKQAEIKRLEKELFGKADEDKSEEKE